MAGRVLHHFGQHRLDGRRLAASEAVGRIAPGAAQRAAGQADEDGRQADPRRLALQRVENFGDAQGQLLLLQPFAGRFGRRGVGVLGEQAFQRTLGCAGATHFLLTGRHRQPGIGRLRAVGVLGGNDTLRLDGALAVALGVPGVAQPVLGIGRQLAVRMLLYEGREAACSILVLAGLELIERGFVFLRFTRRIAGRFGLSRGGRVSPFGCGSGRCLELAQARVEVEVEILLTLLGRFQLVGQRFDLPAQAGDLFGLVLDLAGQIQLGLGLLVESRLRLDALVGDLATRSSTSWMLVMARLGSLFEPSMRSTRLRRRSASSMITLV